MQSWLPYLLHLSDPTLPVGAYTHSNGLETCVQQGSIKNAEDVGIYIRNMLEYNMPYNDALFVCLAYKATEAADIEALLLLDQECTALKAPQELRQASRKLGVRLLKLLSPLIKHTIADAYMQKADGHYCIAFGLYACLSGIPLKETLTAFYYNAATGMVTNSVKLVPLGQQQGQQILYSLLLLLPQLVERTQSIPRHLAGRCSVAFDIRSMQHQRLYSRLYMS